MHSWDNKKGFSFQFSGVMRREQGGQFLKESHRRSVKEKQQRAQVYSSQVRRTGIYCHNDTHKELPCLGLSTQGCWSIMRLTAK